MSNENIVCSHELVVRFDQLKDGSLNWLIQPDEAVENTSHASFDELAEAGAPLSAMGIRALWEMLRENLVFLALEQANGHIWKAGYLQTRPKNLPEPDVEGLDEGEALEGVVVH
mgnify:CR=1 FL=1